MEMRKVGSPDRAAEGCVSRDNEEEQYEIQGLKYFEYIINSTSRSLSMIERDKCGHRYAFTGEKKQRNKIYS